MNAIRLSALGTVVLAAVSAPATAQLEAAMQLPPLHVPIHTAADDEGASYGIWGGAESYKASFHDGMTFVPYLGADYPHNQPWSWRTTGVTVGGVPVCEPGVAPARVQREFRYEYRWPGVTEAYDVRQDGLEQTFVVSQLPARGDLVVEGEVTSALRAPAQAARQQALAFADENGTTIVGYGEAWAFDADGARTPVATAYADGRITLTVPGAWLARAALPVVVDPLLTRVQVFGFQSVIKTVDIGRDEESTNSVKTMVTAVYAASTFDDDVFVRVCNNDFSWSSIVYNDMTTSWDSDGATCAFVGGADRWVVAFRRWFTNNPIRASRIRCLVHDSGSAMASTVVNGMATPSGLNEHRPDIGGSLAFTTGSHALVVYQQEDNSLTGGHMADTDQSRIYGALFDATTPTGTFGTAFPILSISSADIERPSVNQVATGGATFSWLCAMQSYTNTVAMDDWDVLVRRIANDGTVQGGVWASGVAAPNTHHQFAPVIAGRDGRYAVSFATTTVASQPTKSANIRGTSVWVQRLDWFESSSSPTAQPAVELIADVARDYETGCIAYDTSDRSHFAIGCRTIGNAQPAAIGMRVGFRGHLTEGPVTLHTQPGSAPSQLACTFDELNRRFLFAYGFDAGSNQPVFAHPMGYVPVTTAHSTGFGCNPATIWWNGTQQIGGEFPRLRVDQAGPNVWHIMMASTASLDLPVPLADVGPGCRLLVDAFGPGYIGLLDARFGPSVTWEIPLFEWFDPTTLYFQDWILDNGQLSSTRRLEVPIVK
jgi:hypothetical protein